MSALALAGAAFALAAGLLAPGAALVRVLRLGNDGLERFVLALAFGRLLLAAATLTLASSVGSRALPLWGLAGALAWGAAALRARRAGARRLAGFPADAALPLAVALVAGGILVHAAVGRGGLADASGDLVFFGRDSTHDPLVYASIALALHDQGLPLTNPFTSGSASTSSYVPYAVLAGLHGVGGVPMLDLAFRVVPLFDVVALGATAVALVRALGGSAGAAAACALLLALGGEPSFLVRPLGALLGRAVQPLDSWALFGPYLLAFNPIAPALQALFAAALLLARTKVSGRRAALAAGLLVASLFETKLFLWAPAVAALAAVAIARPPRIVATSFRVAALAAVLGSLPSLIEKVLWAATLRGAESERGFALCLGCLPRYLADAALGSHALSFEPFERFRAAALLEPRVALASVLGTALVLALVLGARAAALPELWRGAQARGERAPDASTLGTCAESARAGGAGTDAETGLAARAALCRLFAVAAALGFGLSVTLTVAPHYLNGAQFAWIACFGLWPFAALALGRWLRARALVPLALVALLAFPSSLAALWRLGWAAPISLRVAAAEQELLRELARVSQPGDLVLEPSMLEDTDRPSPIPWLAGRPVPLSLLSVTQNLSREEQEARFERLLAVFAERDPGAAREAIRTSGARFVYAPARWPLHFAIGDALEAVAQGPGGVVYRVVAPAAGAAGRAADPL